MTSSSLETIINNFYCERVAADKSIVDKFPRFGKDRLLDHQQQQNSGFGKLYAFTCKKCGSSSQPMSLHQDIRFRLSAHLTKYCHPSSQIVSEDDDDDENKE